MTESAETTQAAMDHPEDAQVQGSRVAADDSAWGGVEENIDDPEEVRVIFCALDSFL